MGSVSACDCSECCECSGNDDDECGSGTKAVCSSGYAAWADAGDEVVADVGACTGSECSAGYDWVEARVIDVDVYDASDVSV